MIKRLLPQYLDTIAECEAKQTELDARIKAAQPGDDEEEGEDSSDSESEDRLSDDEIKALKKELAAAKKQLKALHADFVVHLDAAVAKLEEPAARELVLGILRGQLDAILSRHVASHRQQIVAVFENWWDKYRVMLISIEAERDTAAKKLRGFLDGLGYV
jgi:type I restriction enzyme M protein